MAWSTLYELSRLSDATLEDGIKNGKINPRTQRKEIVAMLPVKPRRRRPKQKQPTEYQLKRQAKFEAEEKKRKDDREHAIDEVKTVLAKLDTSDIERISNALELIGDG